MRVYVSYCLNKVVDPQNEFGTFFIIINNDTNSKSFWQQPITGTIEYEWRPLTLDYIEV